MEEEEEEEDSVVMLQRAMFARAAMHLLATSALPLLGRCGVRASAYLGAVELAQ